MKRCMIRLLLLAFGPAILAQDKPVNIEIPAKPAPYMKVGGDSPEAIHEQSREVLDAARDLEDSAYRLSKRKVDVRQVKRDIEQLYFQLLRLDQSVPGERVVPSPHKKVKLPPIIDFGTTEAKNGGSVIVHPKDNDYRPCAKIHITNLGGPARYIRITSIEITTPENQVVKVSSLLKHNLYEKVYPRKTYTVTFMNPVRIKAMRISLTHETDGLKIYSIPVGTIAPPVQ